MADKILLSLKNGFSSTHMNAKPDTHTQSKGIKILKAVSAEMSGCVLTFTQMHYLLW